MTKFSSKASLLVIQFSLVAVLNSENLNTGEFLSLDHIDSIALMVNVQAILLALNDLSMFIVLANLGVLSHLLVQLLLIRQEGVSTGSHVNSLFFLLFIQSIDDLDVLDPLVSLSSFQTAIVISKLYLTVKV